MAGDRAAGRRSRACAPALALLGLALGSLVAAPACFAAVARAQPKKPLASYMLWMGENRDRIKSELGTSSIGPIAKEAGRQWREIGAGVKSEYDSRAAELKREYQAELQEFLAAGGVVATRSGAKAKKDPNAPKMPLSAYMRWFQDNRQQIAASLPPAATPQQGVAAVAKAAGVQWKAVSGDEKRKYQDLVEVAKAEYQKQLKEYLAAGGVVAKTSRAKKDPNAPKMPLHAYMRWLQDNRQQIAASLPAGQQGVAAVAKAAGVQWKAVSGDEKRKYQDLVEAAKAEYQKQLKEYQAGAA